MSQLNSGFTALNGAELIEVIKNEVGQALERSNNFRVNTTFPWVKVSFEIKVLAYPAQDTKDEPKIKVVGTKELGQALDYSVPVEETTVTSEGIFDTPDKARVDADLPLHIPSSAGGQIVDKPVQKVRSAPPKGVKK